MQREVRDVDAAENAARPHHEDDQHGDIDDRCRAAGYQIAESEESTPTMKPVSTEPAIDPMPPATTTAKVSAIISWPMKGEMLRIGAARAPATPARPAAQKKVPEMSSGTLPPNI